LKNYFNKLGETLVVEGSGKNTKRSTIFTQLMLTAYKEFQAVDAELIINHRKSVQLEVIQSMDLYAKKGIIRALKNTYKFSSEELLFLCDLFYGVQYYQYDRKSREKINFEDFQKILTQMCDWATDGMEGEYTKATQTSQATGIRFMKRIYTTLFDKSNTGWIDFQTLIDGLSTVIHSSGTGQLFFQLHDFDNDGFLSKEECICFSESLLFLFRKLKGDSPLSSVSSFLNRSFAKEEPGKPISISYTDLMGILTVDEFLVEYLATFPATFVLKDVKIGVFTTVTSKTPHVKEIADAIFVKSKKFLESIHHPANMSPEENPQIDEDALLKEGNILHEFLVDELLNDPSPSKLINE
jgi:Ca2+-binding EF-hand superfamily protein